MKAKVAIIDDVFAGPTLHDVQAQLIDFLAEAQSAGEADGLADHLGLEELIVENIGDSEINKIYCKELDSIEEQKRELFSNYESRLADVQTIRQGLADDFEVECFFRGSDLLKPAEYFFVLLDYQLLDQGDSSVLAKRICKDYKSFIVLMSDLSPNVEEFRRKNRLLQSFFLFKNKAELTEHGGVKRLINSLPKKDSGVCHAIHDFVDAIEKALGGEVDEPIEGDTGELLPRFMQTLRKLGLEDYAMLCELTLRDEGHPMGDYLFQLLGLHLVSELGGEHGVQESIRTLDKLKFEDFLPFRSTGATSIRKLYASSLTEKVFDSWPLHPWQQVPDSEDARTEDEDCKQYDESINDEHHIESTDRAEESEICKLFNCISTGPLPFIQLGDMFIKDEQGFIYVVLSGACDLQFAPGSKRARNAEDSVILLPGALRTISSGRDRAKWATGAFDFGGSWYWIEWFAEKLLSIPHAALVPFFKDKGYKHERRMRLARVLELQQSVFAHVSRIGLEVQPPLAIPVNVQLYGRKTGTADFEAICEELNNGGLLVHLLESDPPRSIHCLAIQESMLGKIVEHMEQLKDSEPALEPRELEKHKRAISDVIEKFDGGRRLVEIPKSFHSPKQMKLSKVAFPRGQQGDTQIRSVFVSPAGADISTIKTKQEVMYCLVVRIPS